MNIIDCLKHDHAQLRKLSKAMTKAEQPADAKAFYLQLRELLVAHSRAEEAVVYRALEKLGIEKLTAATSEGEVEHGLCDHLTDTMVRGRADSVTWKARAMVVCELLAHHLDEEDEEMLTELTAGDRWGPWGRRRPGAGQAARSVDRHAPRSAKALGLFGGWPRRGPAWARATISAQ